MNNPSLPAPRRYFRWRIIALWAVAVTGVVEAITLAVRFGTGVSAAQFSAAGPPLVLRIHHMFWSIPLLLIAPFVWRRPKIASALLGVAIGLVASDLLHHFLILPLLVGNTGWHWP
jgi:hypothetical protein